MYPLVETAKGKRVGFTPIWIMRQAGRYSKRYRELREKAKNFMEFCKNPELAGKATLIPIEELGVDGAILFSDILVIPEAMGISVRFEEGKGPVLEPPVRSEEDVLNLEVPEPEERLSFVLETIKFVKENLKDKPLIGFSGAPFTLASYMIEGGSSKNYENLKTFMRTRRELWNLLMNKLTESVARYLKSQVRAGADIVQIFDSWMGILSLKDYKEFVFPFVKKLVDSFKKEFPDVPVILFGVNSFHLLTVFKELDVDVVGVDWRTPLSIAGSLTGKVIQGNLDPTVLLADREVIRKEVENILKEAENLKAHIFNLGHGILPSTNPDNAKYLVDLVHELSQRRQ